jgi:hypothetical protein
MGLFFCLKELPSKYRLAQGAAATENYRQKAPAVLYLGGNRLPYYNFKQDLM